MIQNIQKSRGVLYAFNGEKLMNSEGQVGDSYNTASWADLVASFNRLFIAAGTGNITRMIDLDGTSRNLTAVVDSSNYPLKAGCIESHRGVFFAGNVPETDGEHLSRLRWSKFGEPENFSPFGPANYQAFQDVGDPMEPIIRLLSVGNNLYIFKRNSIWMAYGASSDFVGPEQIRAITTQVGLVGSNALSSDGSMVKFVSDGGFYSITEETVKEIYKELRQQITWRDKAIFGICAAANDLSNGRMYFLIPKESSEDTEIFVKSEFSKWSKYSWGSRNMSLVKTIPGENAAFFGDFWDGVYTFDDTKRSDFSGEEIITSVWDTGWFAPDKMRVLVRSLELLLRQEGKFAIKVECFKDMNLVPEDTRYLILDQKDPMSSTDIAVTDRDSTASYDDYFPFFMDLSGNAYVVRFRFSLMNQVHSRFKIFQAKLGYIPRGGI